MYEQDHKELKKNTENKKVKTSIDIKNQRLWEMANLIVEKQKAVLNVVSPENINWLDLQGDWFDWLEENISEIK